MPRLGSLEELKGDWQWLGLWSPESLSGGISVEGYTALGVAVVSSLQHRAWAGVEDRGRNSWFSTNLVLFSFRKVCGGEAMFLDRDFSGRGASHVGRLRWWGCRFCSSVAAEVRSRSTK